MFQHVDTLIAFVMLMLIASLVITAATQVVVSFLGLRGANLRRSLADLLETAYPGEEGGHWAKEIAGRVLRHPTVSDSIFAHFRIRAERIPLLPPETAGKLQGISASIPLLPWIMGGVGGFFFTPIVMGLAKWLLGAVVCEYSDALAGYVPAINFCEHPWRTGALVGMIFGGLLGRWRLATSIRVEELPAVLEKLSEPLPGTLPDAAQRAMLAIAWSEKEPGGRTRAGVEQASLSVPVRAKPYFDESIVGRTAKASLQNQSLFHAAADFDEGIVRHAEPVETESSVAVEEESAATHAKEPLPEFSPTTMVENAVASPTEQQVEGLQAWFDQVMGRASQRFAVQARVVTVALACIFVFGWHFDAVRLLQAMSQSAEMRAQLAATAAGIDKQAEQLPHSKQGAHAIVPDVYRAAMVSILRPVSVEPSASNEGSEAKPASRRRARGKEREKVVAPATPAEDSVTTAAKAKAMHELETMPGFVSREEAENWLRATLDESPAGANLVAAYQQEVNTELVSDSDRLMDQSASLKSELARSKFKLFQDEREWEKSSREVPGILVTIALLSLGAAFWYNTLQRLASLRPQEVGRQDRGRKDWQ